MLSIDKTIKEIEYGIMVGRFRPKQRLVESDLMAQFSVGRGIIRDSLKILADRRLVSRDQNKGAIVTELSAKEIKELYHLRLYLEGLAGELAFERISPKDIHELSRLQEKLNSYTRVDTTLVKLHEALHAIIFKASGNDFLVWQINALIVLAGPVRYFSYTQPDQREISMKDHHKMIQSLKKKDKEGFVELCRNHMIPAMKAYIRVFFPKNANSVLKDWEQVVFPSPNHRTDRSKNRSFF